MIDDFLVDGETLVISHNATQVQLGEKTSFIDIAAQLSTYKLRYYTHLDDILFMDDGKGLCLAPQIVAGWSQEASNEDYHVFVPGDTSVYYAKVSVLPQFINVTDEKLLTFSEASNIVNEYPSHSLVHDSGKLAERFRELNIEITHLQLELFEGASHSLHYGINRQQLIMLVAVPVLGLIMALAGKPLLESIIGSKEVQVIEEVVTGPPPSMMLQRLQPDLVSLAQIMNRHSLLALHGLNSLTITPAEDSFSIGAKGDLHPESTVVRLLGMARAHEAAFSFDGRSWSMSDTHPRLDSYETLAPTDIYRQLDAWRLLTTLHNVSLKFQSREVLHDAVRYKLQMTIPAPNPVRLQMLIDDLDRRGISGELSSAILTPGIKLYGQLWLALQLDYTITGVEP